MMKAFLESTSHYLRNGLQLDSILDSSC